MSSMPCALMFTLIDGGGVFGAASELIGAGDIGHSSTEPSSLTLYFLPPTSNSSAPSALAFSKAPVNSLPSLGSSIICVSGTG